MVLTYLHKLDPEIPIDDSKIILANWEKSGESQKKDGNDPEYWNRTFPRLFQYSQCGT